MKKPLIGITTEAITLARPDGRGAFCGGAYSDAITLAGGLPVALPLTNDAATLAALLARCDGILLAGGGDVEEDTGAYGRKLTTKERKTLSSVDAVRDAMEIHLIRQLVEQDKPVLGICRGIQMMNVALGGTLLPDVPNHRQPHRIEWTQGNSLTQTLSPQMGRGDRAESPLPRSSGERIKVRGQERDQKVDLHLSDQVNSTHHQALGRVAPALEVIARAEDGIIEAVNVTGMKFGLGVQFHPERLMPEFSRLFEIFVAAAKK
jgi:putative glutamine amidotransferase